MECCCDRAGSVGRSGQVGRADDAGRRSAERGRSWQSDSRRVTCRLGGLRDVAEGVASSPSVGQSERVASFPTEHTCPSCGRQYDHLDRGVSGPFHFSVKYLREVSRESALAVGHWRSGVWPLGQPLEMRCTDGSTIALGAVEMDPPISETADRRGQRILRVRASQGALLATDRGCIYPVDG